MGCVVSETLSKCGAGDGSMIKSNSYIVCNSSLEDPMPSSGVVSKLYRSKMYKKNTHTHEK